MAGRPPAALRPRARLQRHATLLTAAVLLAGAVAGCGKGGPSSAQSVAPRTSTSTHASTAPSQAPGGAPLTGARARAFARAVNLTLADVPGFAASARAGNSESSTERTLDQRLQRCVGGSPPGPGALGRGREAQKSPNFTRRGSPLGQTVSSSVAFSPSSGAAAAELALLRSARVRDCLTGYVSALMRGGRLGGAAIGHVSIKRGTPPAPGTSGGFGWRIAAAVAVRGLTVPVYVDILGFVYGPAQITLISTGVLAPFPAQGEEQLFRLLVSRAISQPL